MGTPGDITRSRLICYLTVNFYHSLSLSNVCFVLFIYNDERYSALEANPTGKSPISHQSSDR